MKSFVLSIGAAALALAAYSLNANGATIGSFATGASNLGNVNTAMNYGGMSTSNVILGGTGPTFTLNPDGVWETPPANSTWIGYAPTAGPNSGVNPPGTLATPEYYTFTTTFTTASAFSGSLSVDADDTTEVFLNGVEIIGDGTLGGDLDCAVGVPNCTASDTTSISGGAGLQTLTFVVTQAGFGAGTDDPSGVAFDGTVSSVPEPSAFLLMGSGFAFIGAFGRRFLR